VATSWQRERGDSSAEASGGFAWCASPPSRVWRSGSGYEGEAIKNDFNGLTPVQARSRAYEALLELAQGGHALAGALLVERRTAGDGRARTALAEVAAGRWAAAVELLEKLSQVEGDVDATG